MAHRLKKIPHRQESMINTIKKLGSESTRTGVTWMRSKSNFVSDLARLAKFWSQTVINKGCGNGKSFFFELVGAKAALIEEQRNKGEASHTRAFRRFLLMMVNIQHLEIFFTDYYGLEEVPEDLKTESPLLLNPINQFQNLFEVCEEEFMMTMASAASVTLSKMRCRLSSPHFSSVFYPQNLARLNTAVSFRKACFSLEGPASDLMPSVVFNSSWLQPVLSAASNYQKIQSDPSGELRYFLGRVMRLAASVVLCAEFTDQHASPLTPLETFLKDLNIRSVKDENCRRDVQFLIFSQNLNSTISIGIDVVSNFFNFE